MKGIIGCNADWLKPGEVIETAQGHLMTVLRKVDLMAAIELAEQVGDTNFKPFPDEHFYEIDVDFQAQVTNN